MKLGVITHLTPPENILKSQWFPSCYSGTDISSLYSSLTNAISLYYSTNHNVYHSTTSSDKKRFPLLTVHYHLIYMVRVGLGLV